MNSMQLLISELTAYLSPCLVKYFCLRASLMAFISFSEYTPAFALARISISRSEARMRWRWFGVKSFIIMARE